MNGETKHCDSDSHYWDKSKNGAPFLPGTDDDYCVDCLITVSEWEKQKEKEGVL